MAVEALREPTLAAYCAKSGRSEQDIMEEEGHETAITCWLGRGVRSYLRTPDNHRTVKYVRDALEHGYKSVW
jgi:hypothetical protein